MAKLDNGKIDNWANKSTYICETCMYFYRKLNTDLGRCRRHAPIINGFPVVYVTDVCGDHKLNSEVK